MKLFNLALLGIASSQNFEETTQKSVLFFKILIYLISVRINYYAHRFDIEMLLRKKFKLFDFI